MAILKVVTPTDIGAGLAIVANKVIADIDGTSIILDGTGKLSTAVDPSIVNDLVTLSGLPANSTDLGTFTGTVVPDATTVKAAIQALETAIESVNIEGQYAGSAATFAALPTATSDGNPTNNSDWAILTADDGVNESGIYVYDGSAYQLAKLIPEVFALVVETADTDAIALTGDGNTGTELTATLKLDATVAGNLAKVNPGQGLAVDPADVKAALTHDCELQDLGGTTLAYVNSTPNFA